jgi:hypothetical protein
MVNTIIPACVTAVRNQASAAEQVSRSGESVQGKRVYDAQNL